MDVSLLRPDDARVQYVSASVRGKTYEYMIGNPPQDNPVATIFLIHGFPDIPHGWRFQVPYLMSLGFRVVVPSMLGYAGTDAPRELAEYTFKSLSADVKELAAQIVGDGQIILGGHDWGGMLVWRVSMYYPELVKAVFSVCTPYIAPQTVYFDIEELAADRMPNLGYQLQFRGPEVEIRLQGADGLRQFFCGIYGGRGTDGKTGLDMRTGVLSDKLPQLETPRLLPDADLALYVQQYMRQPAPQLRGPLNWYRTARLNYEDELPFAHAGGKIEAPALFIESSDDAEFLPSIAAGMERYVTNLSKEEVKSSHWALTQAGPKVNGIIGMWLNRVIDGSGKAGL